MKNTYIKANLVALNKISVLIFTSLPRRNDMKFFLHEDGNQFERLNIVKSSSSSSLNLFELSFTKTLDFSKHYSVFISDFPSTVLNLSGLVNFPEFDELFNYDGNDLGAIYSKDETSFNLWAPLASDVYLKLDNGEEFINYKMERTPKGVFRTTIKGDLLNRRYSYIVNNSGVIVESNDPYGKGTSLNSEYSAVVDLNYIKNLGIIKPTNEIKNYVDSIIYEVGIRDFSEGNNNNIINKGKYLGFIEENRTTSANNPCGLDYLKYLGVTHVQLNPVIDFRGVDDLNPLPSYNWGYDPISFFALEGSYSLHPEIPMERLIEFKKLVNTLHQNNIRVIMDVVYNHIYEYSTSIFEKVVPNYFFRRKRNQQIAEASGCGDDFASEKYMVRKMVVDSIRYFCEVFDVDGFRFDLMGLMDIKTIDECYKTLKGFKKDGIMYGEGWNMGYELPEESKATIDNAFKMENIAFFNDFYREHVKGATFKSSLGERGYIGGNTSEIGAFEYCISGSVLPINYPSKFSSANQTINYVECHDNNTLFDKLIVSNGYEDEDSILRRVNLANALIVLSIGVPFIHMGQEIGLSKQGLDNTYNVTKINNMDWSLVDERFEMVRYLKGIIDIRKRFKKIRLSDPNEIKGVFSFFTREDDTLLIRFNSLGDDSPYKDVLVAINPTSNKTHLEFDEYYNFLFSKGAIINDSLVHTKNAIISPQSLEIFVLNK